MSGPSRFAWALLAAALGSAAAALVVALTLAAALPGTVAAEPRQIGIVAGVAGLLGAGLAFLAARIWMQRVLAELARAAAESDRHDGAVAPGRTGWAAFDQAVAAIDRLARMRALRIAALARQAARFRALADSTHSAEAWFDRAGNLVWMNRSIEGLTGYSSAECLLTPSLIDLLAQPANRSQMHALARAALRGEDRSDVELRIVRKDGSLRWVSCHWSAMRRPNGRLLGVRLSIEDVQHRKDVEQRLLDTVASLRRAQALKDHYLQRSEDERLRLEALLDALRVGILFVDRDRCVHYINRMARHMWGLGEDGDLAGLRDEELIARTAALRADDDAYRRHLGAVLSRRLPSGPFEIALSDGRSFEEMSALVMSEDSTRYIGRVWIYEDVTERRRSAERLTELAERDPLTRLFNRRRFHEELGRLLAEADRRGSDLALISFDLDGFKAVNDRFGHQTGDKVLVAVAAAALATVRRNEPIFRMGGDEFAVLMPDADSAEAMRLARRLHEQIIAVSVPGEHGAASVGVSIGIALFPADARTGDRLVECADHAMYSAKSQGKNRIQTFGPRPAAAGEPPPDPGNAVPIQCGPGSTLNERTPP